MSCNITTGYNRGCKDRVSGIKKVYIFSYVKYNRSQLVRTGLTLDEFPATVVYQFEPLRGVSCEQKMNEDEGSKYYDQTITLKFSGHQSTYKLQQLIKKDVRIIFEDNNGLLRMLGAYNGLYCDSINSDVGSSKNSFSGLEFSFVGQEREEALFLDELLIPEIGLLSYLLLEDGTFLLLEDGELLELE